MRNQGIRCYRASHSPSAVLLAGSLCVEAVLHDTGAPHTGSTIFATAYVSTSTGVSAERVALPDSLELLEDTVRKYLPLNPAAFVL
jgi:hypothetical protein